jgi:hypothetical protein
MAHFLLILKKEVWKHCERVTYCKQRLKPDFFSNTPVRFEAYKKTRKMVFKRLKVKLLVLSEIFSKQCSNGRNHMRRNLMAIEGFKIETEPTKNI